MRIATTTAPRTVYTDRDVRAGTTYRYAVTALDSARRANESPRSNVVSVRVE
jgi:fibronectin type 3 domain-containing protein